MLVHVFSRCEVLGLMGFPRDRIGMAMRAATTSSLTDLAGNAFSLWAVVPVLVGIFTTLDFHLCVQEGIERPAGEGPVQAIQISDSFGAGSEGSQLQSAEMCV